MTAAAKDVVPTGEISSRHAWAGILTGINLRQLLRAPADGTLQEISFLFVQIQEIGTMLIVAAIHTPNETTKDMFRCWTTGAWI